MKPTALSQFVEYVRSQIPAPTGGAVDETSAGYADQTDDQTQPQPDAEQPQTPFLEAIVVLPQGLKLYGKGWQQFRAIGYLSDGSKPDLTKSAKWWTPDPRLARFGGPGRVFFTGIPGAVMINVQHPELSGGAQTCGTPVAVLPPQQQPPGQPDDTGPVYAQGDSDVSNAASPVEGSGEGNASSGASESLDGLSVSASSDGDAFGASSDTDSVRMAATASASRQVDDFEWPPTPRPHVHKPLHDPNPDMTGKPTGERRRVIQCEGTADLSSATSTVGGTAPGSASDSGSAGGLSADATTGGDASASATSSTDDSGGLSASATATSE